MTTYPGSEVGGMSDTLYITEEIKVCPRCGLRVRETYRAEQILVEPPTIPVAVQSRTA
jgi:hypothetical protein